MKRQELSPRSLPMLLVFLFTVGLTRPNCAADSSPLPPGVVEFAGRLARNCPDVLGSGNRDALVVLNRELREAKQQIDKATTDDERSAAMGRAATAAAQLLQKV